MNIFETVVAKASGISASSPLASVLSMRNDIFELTEKAYQASLRPNEPGGVSHAERAGLACRIARRNNEAILAQHYETLFGIGSKTLADTDFDGGDDIRNKAIIRHTDLVTLSPKDAKEDDISALKSAGLDDADIVRLSELLAFVAYQIRVVIGLRLMAEVA